MKKIYSLIISCVLLCCAGSAWGETLTVYDDTSSSEYVPIEGYNCDIYLLRSQIIYPASELTSIVGKNITALTFYLKTSAGSNWGINFDVYVTTTTNTGYSSSDSFLDVSGATKVYSNAALNATSSTMTITFSTPFAYNGGNLLVDIQSKAKGTYSRPYYYGYNTMWDEPSIRPSMYGKNSSNTPTTGSGTYFYPKTTFTYSAAAPITCAAPTTVTVADENIGSNSATITLAGLNNATIEYKLKNASVYTIAQTGVTGTSYLLSGLESYTEYDVQVKNVCGGTDGESSYTTASFRTKCGAKSLPFAKYGFEDVTTGYSDYNIPACWDKIASGNYPYVYGYSSGKTGNSLYFRGGKAGSSEQAIIFPDFSTSLAGYTLTFYHKEIVDENWYGMDYIYGKFEVGYVLNNSFTSISGEIAQLSDYAEDPTEVSFTAALPEGAKLAIRYAGGENTGTAYIDDVAIKVTPSCSKPTLNNATSPTFEGATFTWTAGASETQWQYIVVSSGAAEDWSSPTTVSTNTVTLTGYNAGTTYDFYVRSYCSSSEQSEGAKKSFTTATVTAPTNVTISGETTIGASASWDAVSGISQYQYVIMDAGVAADWTSPTTVNTNSAPISGLEPGSSYDFYVRSYYAANGATAAAEKVNFRTACTAIASAASWTDSFDDYATGSSSSKAPGCWKLLNANEGGHAPHIYVKNNSDYFYSGWAKDGTQYLFFSAYSDAGYGFAIFPEFETAVSSLQIKFSYIIESGSTLDFGYLTDISDASTFNSLKSCTSTSLTDDEVALSTVPTGARLAFRHIGNSSSYKKDASVDAISFEALSTCDKPQNLSAATNITPEGATFNWAAGGTETQYQWAVAEGTADPVWIDDAAHKVSTTSKTLTGLTLGTSYKFYVRSYCAGDSQSEALESEAFAPALGTPANIAVSGLTATTATLTWDAVANATGYTWLRVAEGETKDWNNAQSTNTNYVSMNTLTAQTNYTFYVRAHYEPTGVDGAEASIAFATPCLATTLPFAENFDEGMPSCWNNANGTTTTDAYKWSSFNENYDGNTGKCVRFDSYNNNSGRTNTLETQPINLSVNAELKFWWKNPTGGAYSVQISTNGGTTKTTLKDNMTGQTTWVEEEGIDLSAYTGNIVTLYFNGTSNGWNNQAYLYLDEVRIEALPTCFKPATLNEATAITVDGATFSWTASGKGETDYQYAVALAGEAPVWNVANVVEGATTVTIDGLQAQTNYDFYVRSYCGSADQSEWRKVSFRTGCGVYDALPFDEDFNSVAADAIPECWDNSASTMETPSYLWQVVNYSGRNGSKCLRCGSMADPEEEAKTNILVSPEIRLGAGKQLLTFWCKKPEADNFVVKVTKDNGANFTQLLDLTEAVIADWTLKFAEIPAAFSNQVVKFYFCNTANSQGDYIYIDDVRVARGEVFEDVENNETRLSGLSGVLDVVIGRTIFCDGDYNTICLPFSLSEVQLAASPLAGATFKAFTSAVITSEELQVNVAEVKSGLVAGVPYLLKMSAANNLVSPLFKNVTISATVGNTIGQDEAVEFIGTFNPVPFAKDDESTLFVYTNNTLTWSGIENTSLKGFRAYFHRTNTSAGAPLRHGMRARIVEQEETATGIDNTQSATVQSVKILENDHVVIIRNGVKYNIQGQIIEK